MATTTPRRTDVLIVGSGSAGIFAATWLALFNIPFTMLERRSGPLEVGQADGVQCRTVEIYESFGVAEELLREAYHILEIAFWGVEDSDGGKGGITRKSRAPDREQGLSHCPHVILNQARMNSIMLDVLRGFRKGHGKEGDGIEYGVGVKGVEVGDTGEEYCCKVSAERNGVEEVWEAKYVLGCDGAHSVVRRSLGYQMVGDTTDTVWGVMDIYPLTNFPDIRRKSTVHSSAGNLLIIPREGGSLVRFYIQLPPGSKAKDVRLEDLQETAKKIFHPYTMDFADTYWWSAYSIGQRLADHFHKDFRVFLTGDACHTHSPKAGQGMNVSLQDGYNIGWKLGHVLNKIAPPSLLETYVSERSKVAKELIDFDREFARMFSSKEERPGQFADHFTMSGRYTAGFGVHYEDDQISDSRGSDGSLAGKVVVGARMPSAQLIRWCDCKAVQLLKVLKSDGRWRVVVFAGDIAQPTNKQRLEKLATQLGALTKRFTPAEDDVDSLIEPILVLKTKFTETEQHQIPDYFVPVNGKWRIRDLHKVYIDDQHYNDGHGEAYRTLGVDPAVGAVVIIRPDQYVSKVTRIEDVSGIESFFKGALYERGD
ncbi:phenol 2-monooxygenase-like protein [Aaosphaeria arxii CBS 175.79]|uniref:Phenol 2-monooxygenase-like protein n=1 Tax=Aaosphaeria arxii CBS 175.79 TaxID=1450172 RepID=A0A6A5XE84_9PLEO|nr:phenol 2-monooxygenase-like protein [Aaosphaeria arxii CBS 175.79]KAF2011495.1 phenol 2-monooxygenase-like protein [Aaosphaeria arxii CBS 175.79]